MPPLTAPNAVMQSEYAINGTHGRLYANGEIISEIQSVAATIRLGRRDIMRAGSRNIGYKMMTTAGEGSISYVKVTDDFVKAISEPFRDANQPQRLYDLRTVLDDPESLGIQELQYLKVRFWELPLGFNVNDIIEESIPFTFEGFKIIQSITGDPTISLLQANYTALD